MLHRAIPLILLAGILAPRLTLSDTAFKPIKLDDDLPIATPSSVKMDESLLDKGVRQFAALPYSHSLLVMRDGKLVSEAYFHGYDINTPNRLASVTKSVTSALLGIAIDHGLFPESALDQPVKSFFAQEFLKVTDPMKEKITLKQLLTMSAGFDANDGNPSFNQACFNDVTCIWERPLAQDPGKVFSYVSAYADIVARIIADAYHRPLREFAEKFLFDPMGIRVLGWPRNAMDYYLGESGLYLRSRDILKFGWLFLNQGAYKNKRLLSAHWVSESTSPKIKASAGNGEYGYFWWMKTKEKVPFYYAWGYGGQYIYVVPSKKLVIALTSDSYQQRPQAEIRKILDDMIVGAAQ